MCTSLTVLDSMTALACWCRKCIANMQLWIPVTGLGSARTAGVWERTTKEKNEYQWCSLGDPLSRLEQWLALLPVRLQIKRSLPHRHGFKSLPIFAGRPCRNWVLGKFLGSNGGRREIDSIIHPLLIGVLNMGQAPYFQCDEWREEISWLLDAS